MPTGCRASTMRPSQPKPFWCGSLRSEGVRRDDLGRERFVERAWEWSRTYGGAIDEQFRRLGFGPDWQRSRFTMDEGLSAAVRRVFVTLYREGLVYRGQAADQLGPDGADDGLGCRARSRRAGRHALADTVSVRSRAARRASRSRRRGPETMLGDVAIAVHPDDARYAALIGRSVFVPPLLERAIPIVADAAVDPEFGTGAVKVTPAHDPVDYEIGDATRARDAVGHRSGRPNHGRRGRRRTLRGTRPLRSARADRRGAPRTRVPRCGRSTPALRRDERTNRRRRRAAALAAVVRQSRTAGRAGARSVPQRTHPNSPGAVRPHLRTVAGEHSRLERFAADLVGPSTPRVVRARRQGDRRRE